MTLDQARELAEHLNAGRTRRQISEAMGIGIRTVSTWRKSPLVIAEQTALAARTDEVRAVDVLVELLGSQDERVRLEAAKLVLTTKIQRAPEEPLPEAAPTPAPEGFVQIPLRRPVIEET